MIAQRTDNTPMYADAYIDELADEYVDLGLAYYGVTLLQFLAEPDAYRDGNDPRFLPLTPEQQAVQDRLDAEAEAVERAAERARPGVRCRGGALVEPLHRHAHTKRSPTANFRRHVARRSKT